jgi:hypothetical protein
MMRAQRSDFCKCGKMSAWLLSAMTVVPNLCSLEFLGRSLSLSYMTQTETQVILQSRNTDTKIVQILQV